MRREIVELVEAARDLQVLLAPRPDNHRSVRIGGPRDNFPDRLWRIAVALERVDRAGAAGLSQDEADDPVMDAAKLRMALDGVFRWMRSNGMDVSEPHSVVSAALGAQGKVVKAGKGYKPVPQFAHNGYKKSVRTKPLMRLDPNPGERVTIDGLRQKDIQAEMTEVSFGPAAPRHKLTNRK